MRTKKLYSKKDKIFLKKQQERLDDPRVYDEATGRFYTIEELENETVFQPADDNQLYSDEEIEKIFTDNPVFPLTHNELIKKGYLAANCEDIFDIFLDTAMANSFNFCQVHQGYGITAKSNLMVMNCEYQLINYWATELYFIGAVPFNQDCGHILLERLTWKEGLFRHIDKSKSKVIQGWNAVFFDDHLNEETIESIINCFAIHEINDSDIIDNPDHFNASIEVFNKILFFKSEKPIDVEKLAAVLSVFPNLEEIGR